MLQLILETINELVKRSVRDQFLSGVTDWPQPWLLMMIELWSREVLDK